MDSFAGDRDYSISYLEGFNKCDYARMAVSAYESSLQGPVEKREFLAVLENFRVLFEERSIVVYDGMDEVVGVDLHRLYDLAYLVEKAYNILFTTEDWELQTDFELAEAEAGMEGIAFVHPLRDVQDEFGFVIGATYHDFFFFRIVVFSVCIVGWRTGASSRGVVLWLP